MEPDSFYAETMEYGFVWWWLVVFCITIAVAVLWAAFITRSKTSPPTPNIRATLNSYLTEIDKLYAMTMKADMPVQEAAQRISLMLKRTVANANGLSVSTLSDFRNTLPSQHPLIPTLEYLYPVLFNGQHIQSPQHFADLVNFTRSYIVTTNNHSIMMGRGGVS